MTFFITVSTVSFLFLGIIWSRSSWMDLLVKVYLLCMGSFGVFLLLQLFGYVVKV